MKRPTVAETFLCLSHEEAATLLTRIYRILYEPPDQEWSMDTLSEIETAFVSAAIPVPGAEEDKDPCLRSATRKSTSARTAGR